MSSPPSLGVLQPPLGAPPAEAFPDWPIGWYLATSSRRLCRNPVGLDLFGRRLVAYRTSSGQPVVMDARCWHMGADLSAGIVVDDHIVCPFHGWRYASSGHCCFVPGDDPVPPGAYQRAYATAENSGGVFVFPSSEAYYPLPFFDGVDEVALIGAPPFELAIGCPWWLAGGNGFDLQHFAQAHDRRLVVPPVTDSPHPAARRMVATFAVCGVNWRDRLTRRFAGPLVTMDVTISSGTLAFVIARFHGIRGSEKVALTTYGMIEIRPCSSAPRRRSLVRVSIFRHRRSGLRPIDWLDLSLRRHFVRVLAISDARVLDGARYRPGSLIPADYMIIDYLRWLVAVSGAGTFWEDRR